MKLIYTFLFSLCISALLAQSMDRLDVSFIVDGKELANPLTGGYESPQFNEIDINLDGFKDLLVFDRKGAAIRTYIYDPGAENPYIYRPEYESNFPPIGCWVIVMDYDGDGIDDLFTCGVTDPITGIEVWKGYIENGELRFKAYNHDKGPYNIIYYNAGTTYKQLYVGTTGLPAIADVDGDGDIDILAFQPSGGYLYYFKNISVESGWGRDSLEFIREEDCWGKFYEGGLFPDIFLSDDENTCAPPQGLTNSVVRHEGITVTAFDSDLDSDIDLLIGEVSSDRLIYVENGGNSEKAFATFKENGFPSYDVPAEMPLFLASFILDYDKDGLQDLVVAPNTQFGKNTEQAMLYRRVVTEESSYFEFITDDWIVGESLDFGTDSHPAFVDVNGDGLIDLVVGSYGVIGSGFSISTSLYYFENVGSVNNPIFELKDDDFLNFSAYVDFDKSYSPDFGDLDGDGDLDLILGTLNGTVIFMENIAGAGNPMEFAQPVFNYFDLDTENNTTKVTIGDVNNDGLADILVGGRNSYNTQEGIGSIMAFINVGEPGSPIFNNQEVIKGIGGINVKDAGTSRASASPQFINSEVQNLIALGNDLGRISVYKVNYDGNYELLEEDFLGYRIGRKTAVDLYDIDNDGYLEMVVGNERGGLNIFDTTIQTSGIISGVKDNVTSLEMQIYPNPANDFIEVISNFPNPSVSIYDNIGNRVIHEQIYRDAIQIADLPPGMYYLKVNSGRHQDIAKFIKF